MLAGHCLLSAAVTKTKHGTSQQLTRHYFQKQPKLEGKGIKVVGECHFQSPKPNSPSLENQTVSYSFGAPLDHLAPLGSTSMNALGACRYPRSTRFGLWIMTRTRPTAFPAIGLFTEQRSGGSPGHESGMSLVHLWLMSKSLGSLEPPEWLTSIPQHFISKQQQPLFSPDWSRAAQLHNGWQWFTSLRQWDAAISILLQRNKRMDPAQKPSAGLKHFKSSKHLKHSRQFP